MNFLTRFFHTHSWKHNTIIKKEWYGCIEITSRKCTVCSEQDEYTPCWSQQLHCKYCDKDGVENKCRYYQQCYEEDKIPLPDSGNYVVSAIERLFRAFSKLQKVMMENPLPVKGETSENNM